MIPVSEFAKDDNNTIDDVILMIKNGDYYGKEINGVWHIDPKRTPPNAMEETEKEKHIKTNKEIAKYDHPIVVIGIYIIAGITLIGGILFSIGLWPGEAEYGYSWKAIAYMSSVATFAASIVQFVLLCGLAKIIIYLGQIEINTRTLRFR